MSRRAAASSLYALSGLGLLVATGLMVRGVPASFSLGPVWVGLGSWAMLRLPVVLLLLALWLDVRRASRLAVLEARLAGGQWWLVPAAGLALAAYLVWFKLAQHASLRTGSDDLYLFASAFESTRAGQFFHAWGIDRPLFSEHFFGVVLLLWPGWRAFPGPEALLVQEALGLALAAWPLWLLARREGLSRLLSALVLLVFFLNRHLWLALEFDFHPEPFAVAPFFAAVWAARARHFGRFYVFLALTLLVKEDVALLTLGLGFWLCLRQRKDWRHGIGAMALSVAALVVTTSILIPWANPDGAPHSRFVERYRSFGEGYGGIAKGLAAQPGTVVERLASPSSGRVVASLALLPLLDPLACIAALPALAVHTLSDLAGQQQLIGYYALFGLLMLFAALPRVLSRIEHRFGLLGGVLAAAAMVLSSPGAQWPSRVTAQDDAARAVMRALTGPGLVSAQTTAIAHLPVGRQRVLYPAVGSAAQVVLLPCRSPWPQTTEAYWAGLEVLFGGADFGVTQAWGEGAVLTRGAPTAGNGAALEALAARCRR